MGCKRCLPLPIKKQQTTKTQNLPTETLHSLNLTPFDLAAPELDLLNAFSLSAVEDQEYISQFFRPRQPPVLLKPVTERTIK